MPVVLVIVYGFVLANIPNNKIQAKYVRKGDAKS